MQKIWESNLAILNLHVTPMPPTKFGFNPTYRFEADVVWSFSRLPSWGPSLISEQNDFSNYEYQCCSDASHQVSALSDLQFGRRWNFSRLLTWLPSWILEWNDFSNSKSPCGTNTSHQVWAQSDLGVESRCGLKFFKVAVLVATLDRWTEQF